MCIEMSQMLEGNLMAHLEEDGYSVDRTVEKALALPTNRLRYDNSRLAVLSSKKEELFYLTIDCPGLSNYVARIELLDGKVLNGEDYRLGERCMRCIDKARVRYEQEVLDLLNKQLR